MPGEMSISQNKNNNLTILKSAINILNSSSIYIAPIKSKRQINISLCDRLIKEKPDFYMRSERDLCQALLSPPPPHSLRKGNITCTQANINGQEVFVHVT